MLITLRQLTRERERLVNHQTVFKNNLHSCKHQAFPPASTIQRTKEAVSFIKEQIKSIDKEIKAVMEKDEEIKRKLPYLKSIPALDY
jgi:sugar-specific transcriptional regulator TrmB